MNYKDHILEKLLKKPEKNLIKEIIKSEKLLSPKKNTSYRRHIKYTIEDYIIGIIDVLNSHISWNRYIGFIKGNTLRKKHNEWCNLGIYEHAYKNILKRYINTKSFTEELKYQSIDSTFVEDINGSKYSKYSGIYKRRKGEVSKGIKITSLVTTNGIPISIDIKSANKYDAPLLPNVVNNKIINCNTRKYSKNNKYKQYLMADTGYDSKKNLTLLKRKGYTHLIKQNRRNIKDKKLLRRFNEKQRTIYKKRNIVENYHAWIKKFPKVKSLYERNVNYYRGLLLIAIGIIISRRIVTANR